MPKPMPLIPIFLLLIFISHLSMADISLNFFDSFNAQIPTANQDKSIFEELDKAEPLFDEMFAEMSIPPPSPVHPIHQEHYLNMIDSKNPQGPGVESDKPDGPSSKLSRKVNKSFKGLSTNWSKLRKALKGKDFIIMMKNAKRMVQTIKEMEKDKVKDALIRTISDAAEVKRMLTSPLGEQKKFMENVKLHCTEGLLALLPEAEISDLEPFKFGTLTDQWTVIKMAGKTLLDIYKTPNYGEKRGGGHNDDGHNENQQKFYRILKTLSIPELLADPELLKKRQDEEENSNKHVTHEPRRRKRSVVYIALFLLLLLLGAIWVGLQKCTGD